MGRTIELHLVLFLTLSCGFEEPRISLNGTNAVICTIEEQKKGLNVYS